MKNRRYGNLSLKIAVAAFVVFAFLAVAAMQMKFNDVKDKHDELKQEIALLEESVNDLKNQLALPFDDEYVEQVAREKLGLCYPDEVIIESNLN